MYFVCDGNIVDEDVFFGDVVKFFKCGCVFGCVCVRRVFFVVVVVVERDAAIEW